MVVAARKVQAVVRGPSAQVADSQVNQDNKLVGKVSLNKDKQARLSKAKGNSLVAHKLVNNNRLTANQQAASLPVASLLQGKPSKVKANRLEANLQTDKHNKQVVNLRQTKARIQILTRRRKVTHPQTAQVQMPRKQLLKRPRKRALNKLPKRKRKHMLRTSPLARLIGSNANARRAVVVPKPALQIS